MPPKPRDREAEAVEAEEAKATKHSKALFDHALDARMVSRVRPSSLTELKPSKVLKRSDCKDIHKKSTVKKSRYMTVFPGQLGSLKEGRLGSLAKLDTQNPVMYIEYPGFGRLKLEGTIVRSRSTRYFTLNVKSKDRLNLEDWFDSMIVFSKYKWVGTVESNPGEEPLPFPDELKFVQDAVSGRAEGEISNAKEPLPTTIPDFTFSVAAEEGAKPVKTGNVEKADKTGKTEATKDSNARSTEDDAPMEIDNSDSDITDEEDRAAVEKASTNPPARPRRESAKAARYDFSEVDDFDLEEKSDEEEKVFRGRVTATVAKESALLAAPKRKSVGASEKSNAPKRVKPTVPKPAARKTEVLTISDDDDGDDEPEPIATSKKSSSHSEKEKKETAPARRVSAGVPRAAAAAPPKKKFVLDSDDDSDEDEEEEDSDFEA
tara:strand:- start:46883 stop:48181 length:1299 start_codon:yes stop_codon:yes gene_type:complete